MAAKPITPITERLLREGLTDEQRDLFASNLDYVYEWVETRYDQKGTKGKVRDYETACSDAVLALHRAAATHDGRKGFRRFLNTALENAMKDAARREKPQKHTGLEMPVDPEDGKPAGIDADSFQQPGTFRERSPKPKKRYRGGLSSVLVEVIKREAQEAYQRGLADGWKRAWRGALEACGLSDREISEMIALEEARLEEMAEYERNREKRERRTKQQRERRAKARQLATV